MKERIPLIDALKALASQLIVLHHLAFYGPLSDTVHTVAPALIDWLYDYGRMAVQVFLVIAGFLAPRSLLPEGRLAAFRPLAIIGRRYVRIMAPYLAAISLAIVCSAMVRGWMPHTSIPPAPSLPQLFAHVFLLQDILGYEALSAGVWYVAIDFQLFILMAALIWLGQRLGPACGGSIRAIAILVSIAGLASLLYFNRDDFWDSWGLYFFGAYALGTLAFWASATERSPLWLAALLIGGIAVLIVDFRLRISVALFTALLLGAARRTHVFSQFFSASGVVFLGRISYSVFLVHFPVCLVVNSVFHRLAPVDPLVAAIGLLCAWLASTAAGALFYRHVESPVTYRHHQPAAR